MECDYILINLYKEIDFYDIISNINTLVKKNYVVTLFIYTLYNINHIIDLELKYLDVKYFVFDINQIISDTNIFNTYINHIFKFINLGIKYNIPQYIILEIFKPVAIYITYFFNKSTEKEYFMDHISYILNNNLVEKLDNPNIVNYITTKLSLPTKLIIYVDNHKVITELFDIITAYIISQNTNLFTNAFIGIKKNIINKNDIVNIDTSMIIFDRSFNNVNVLINIFNKIYLFIKNENINKIIPKINNDIFDTIKTNLCNIYYDEDIGFIYHKNNINHNLKQLILLQIANKYITYIYIIKMINYPSLNITYDEFKFVFYYKIYKNYIELHLKSHKLVDQLNLVIQPNNTQKILNNIRYIFI